MFWAVVLKTLESPLGCKEIKPVNPKGNQSGICIRRTDAEAETSILWPHDVKSWLIRKDPDAWKDRGQEKEPTEDEVVGWHHWLNGIKFEQTQGDTGRQGSLAVHGVAEKSDTTDRLNNKSHVATGSHTRHFSVNEDRLKGLWNLPKWQRQGGIKARLATGVVWSQTHALSHQVLTPFPFLTPRLWVWWGGV